MPSGVRENSFLVRRLRPSQCLSPSSVQSFTSSAACYFPWLSLFDAFANTHSHTSLSLCLSFSHSSPEFFLSLFPVLLSSTVPLLIYIFSGFASSLTVYILISRSPSLLSTPPPAALEGISPFVSKPFNCFVLLSFVFYGACRPQKTFCHYKVVFTLQ